MSRSSTGKDLTGWEMKQAKGDIKDFWSVKEGGILSAKAGTGWISTTKEYGDFVLRVEWRIQADGNSGVFLRVPGVVEGKSPSGTGMEIQIPTIIPRSIRASSSPTNIAAPSTPSCPVQSRFSKARANGINLN